MFGAQRVVRNWSFLIVARVVGLVSSMAFVFIIVRKLGPSGYGQYTFVLIFTSYFAFLSEFCLDRVVIQRVTAEGAGVGDYLLDSLVARWGLSGLAILCILSLMGWSGRPELSTAFVIASGSLLATSSYNAFSALFQAFERMDLVALVEIPYTLIRSAAGAAVVVMGLGLLPLLAISLAVDLLRVIAGLAVLLRAFRPVLAPPKVSVIRSLVRAGVPLSLWLFSNTVEFRMNVLVLARYWDDRTIGWYSASYKLIDLISMMVLALSSALLPFLCRLHAKSRQEFVTAYGQIFRLLLIVLLPITLGTTVFASRLIVLLFGQAYLHAASSLQLLVWVAVVMSLQYACGTAILATGRWNRVPILGLIVTITAVLTAFLFIPTLGHVGAALALLTTELVNLCATYVVLQQSTGGVRLQQLGLGRLAPTVALWGVVVWLLRDANLFIATACVIPLYVLLATFFGVVTPQDFEFARTLLPQRINAWLPPRDVGA